MVFGQITNIFVNMGTTLSRIHANVFDSENSYTMHILFNVVDYLLLEKQTTDPNVMRTRQDILCKTNISCVSLMEVP